MKPTIAPLFLCFAASFAYAGCPGDEEIARYVADFRAGTPSLVLPAGMNLADAACARDKLVAALPPVLGKPVGYKAVFTNAESQRRFGVDGPAWGTMFDGMMLPSGSRLPAKFGAKPRYEADFVVVVRDAGLADARTPLEALAHIRELVPFMELPDLMIDGAPTGPQIVAANAAFRGGAFGPRLAVEPSAALADALANMEVIVSEERSGREIGRAKGSVLMDNPLNAAIWLAQALRRDGVTLRPGDWLSLGGFLASTPTQPGTTIKIRYSGLPGDPAVAIDFD